MYNKPTANSIVENGKLFLYDQKQGKSAHSYHSNSI